MKGLLVIVGIGIAVVSATVAVLVHAAGDHAGREARIAAEREARRIAAEGRRQAADEGGTAAKRDSQHQAEEPRLRAEEEARATADAKQPKHAEEEAQIAVKQEGKRGEARRTAEEEAHIAAEQEDRLQVEEARNRPEENARASAEAEPVRRVEAERERVNDEVKINAKSAVDRLDLSEAEHPSSGDNASSPGVYQDQASQPQAMQSPEANRESPIERPDQGSTVVVPKVPVAAPRTPRQYRPTARVPAAPPRARSTSSEPERESRARAISIEVRLMFEKGGFCRITLLPRRAPEMPAEFPVMGSGNPPDLLALQGEWYQDVVLPNIEVLLRKGIEWTGTLPNGHPMRFSLSGRDLYVLARHPRLNGFVSTPRLVLEEEHIVLCLEHLLPDVRAAIAFTLSPEPFVLNSENGIPPGWVGLRGVLPHRPIMPSLDGDILDALKPLADLEIALNGGIRIDRQAWLSGFPPIISLVGDASSVDAVAIDGQPATLAAGGGYVAQGWNSPGEHSIACTSSSRRYAIRTGAEEWEPWDAYAWSLGEFSNIDIGAQPHGAICGVLVRPPRMARPDGRAIVVAASNPVLIGTRPGEIAFCAPRLDVSSKVCVGFPWFEPIWALPTDTLHCDRLASQVRLIGSPKPALTIPRPRIVRTRRRHAHIGRYRTVYLWCTAILEAGKKRLRIDPGGAATTELWESYREVARTLWRSMR